MRGGGFWRPRTAVAVVLAVVVCVAAQAGARAEFYDGMELVALPPDPAVAYDTPILDPGAGIDNLVAALDALYRDSPASVAAIEAIKRQAHVIIVYAAAYPPPQSLRALHVARFAPRAQNFTVIVGRHGIKWPAKALAGAIAHELVGHATQHLAGRDLTLRAFDAECEAMLLQERAHQDLGIDKLSRLMVQVRQSMEWRYCGDFKTYARKFHPQADALWDRVNPDVTRLLDIFEAYVRNLHDTGATVAALRKAVELRASSTLAPRFGDGPAMGLRGPGLGDRF